MKQTSLRLAALLALGSALGCGPEFDPSSEVTTLRVLGLKKDKPYAQPGETVQLQLLWHDAKDRDRVQTLFIDGCVNPPGDLYYGCFEQYGEAAAQGTLRIDDKDRFDVTLPRDIISSRRGEVEPGQTPYGVDIVFFAVCAGRIELAMDAASADGSAGLPVRCLDHVKGTVIGSEGFIVGYTTIYSFEDVSNTNPAFTVDGSGVAEFLIAGKPVAADCVGEACQGAADVEVDCADEPERCIEPCEDDGDSVCPEISVAPVIDPSVVERDDVSSDLFDEETSEQMWINYYVDHGSVSEVRLLNDSNSGWNEEYRGELRAPKEPGRLKLWAVSHDNRGGMDFARVTLRVE
jgi:hypothetical protein